MKKLVLVLLLLFALSVFGLNAGELDAKVLCIAGDCRTVWPTGGTGGFDGNFYSIPDFNKLYWTQTDSNLTFYKQTDLNSLLQVSDFNNVYVSWTDANLTYWTQTDLNSLLQLYDFNGMIQNFGENLNWNLDTNAQTACGNNEVLLGDGNCLLYELGETYLPDTILTVAGTDSNNNDVNAIRFYDSNSYTVDEDGGSPALQVDVNFSDVNSFDSISFRQQYLGGAGHEIIVEIYDYDDLLWEEYAEITDQGSFVVSNIPVYDDSMHILDGNVSVRFRHEQAGIPTHVLLIDFVWLIKGTTTGVTSEHDALSGRDSNSNHPWALDKSDLNNFAGILHEAIADFNFAVLFAYDWNKLFYTQADLNSLIQVPDFNNMLINLGEGQGWNTSASGDGNFYSLDGNKVYYTQTDLNITLQITDFNNVYATWIDSNATYWKQIDLNASLGTNKDDLHQTGNPNFNSIDLVGGFSVGGNASFNGTQIGGSSRFAMSLTPTSDDQYYIGHQNLRWKVIYGYDLNMQGDVNSEERFCIDGDCISAWADIGTGAFDGNFYSIPDFNKLYWTQTDSNLTFYKQTDLNSLIQVPDFNNMLINLGEGQGWDAGASSDGNFYSIPDFNILFMKIVDANGNFALVSDVNGNFSLISDVNGADSLRALITDVNGADSLRPLITDVNGVFDEPMRLTLTTDWNATYLNVGGGSDGNFYSIVDFNILFMKIADVNENFALISDVNGADVLRALITDVNGADNLRAKISDINGTYSKITDINGTYYKEADLNSLIQVGDFNNVYASWIDANQTFWKQVDLNSLLQITDFNDMIINLGEGQGWNLGGDGNFMSIPDSNKWFWTQLDLNAFFQIWDFNNVYAKIIDMNTDRSLKAYTSDVNATDALKANILDVNGADLKIKTDLNFYFWKQLDLNWFFTNKLNLFDLNVGHDQNIGNDLNVAHNIQAGNDINATRTISIKTPVTTIEQIPDINIIWKYTNGSVTYCTRVMADGNLHTGQGAGCN